MVNKFNLLERLLEEKNMRLKGGLYHLTQIKFSYNSNHIEGSKLSEEQTRYIYETNTINIDTGKTANVDDIIETVNHFACFDFLLDIAKRPLSHEIIKEFHRILKTNTSDSRREWFKVGDYKTMPNVVADTETTPPGKVYSEMSVLLDLYNRLENIDIKEIIKFHYNFEKIHPFQDGNGRVGRLVMFKECLKYGIMPFIIEDEYKFFYYRGLKEFLRAEGYLVDACLSAQDKYAETVSYFSPE
ncbi:MAG: Fic family protein [Treponema sp.]|nr:Fic family protein [Treponema sp.]